MSAAIKGYVPMAYPNSLFGYVTAIAFAYRDLSGDIVGRNPEGKYVVSLPLLIGGRPAAVPLNWTFDGDPFDP